MDKKELEAKLSKLMDDIPEIEGLVALDKSGKVIVGQSLTEMDLATVAKNALASFNTGADVGKAVGKGGVQSILLSLDKGSACIVGNEEMIIISFQGEDASSSISLILRFMKGIVS